MTDDFCCTLHPPKIFLLPHHGYTITTLIVDDFFIFIDLKVVYNRRKEMKRVEISGFSKPVVRTKISAQLTRAYGAIGHSLLLFTRMRPDFFIRDRPTVSSSFTGATSQMQGQSVRVHMPDPVPAASPAVRKIEKMIDVYHFDPLP
ncbi:hypothetical protein [Paracoccus homiensis]|uniref:hypothetical protein n=1 Tax=Paracoccus homiensis TaxID=364199 RepID=UPI001587C1DF|nr:hypothetical protein [Paracoccus homiensis]